MERVNHGLGTWAGIALCLSVSCSGAISGGGKTPAGGGATPPGATGGSTPPTAGGTTPPAGGTTTPGGTTKPPAMTPTTPPQNPGYMVVRRLNRVEYNNTVADLLGTKLKPANDFPSDDLGGEFDTVGSALSLAPEYVLSYEAAASALVDDLFSDATRQKKIVTCDVATGGDACAQTILTAFARQAWRRPVAADEPKLFMGPVAAAKALGATPLDGLKAALTSILISPYFLYKLEIDPNPLAGSARRLNPYELATRLSYALWSTMPDAVLSAAADAGQLATDEQVTAQVTRMLADPRSDALLDTFAASWLDFGLDAHEVVSMNYPKYTPAIGTSMQGESRRYMQEFLRNPLDVSGMLNSRFTFLDANLATFYGLPRTGATTAAAFVKVDTTGTNRQGLLTLGSFLTTTSYPNRTSPVRRGEYVFRRLLCDEVPAPPPDVPQLNETPVAGQTLRQRLEAHRANPACRTCHDRMDPIGFGLENYDGVGVYRTTDSGVAVDSAGMLPDGTTFNGAIELGGIIARDPRLPQCVTEKVMMFSIGRLLDQPDDGQWIGYLAGRAKAGDNSLPTIIRTVLTSDAFRSRQPGVRM